MAKSLVVVESPAKAKTIEKYLGSGYKVLATYGHIKDLPERDLGIDIDKGFEPNYQLTSKAKKIVNELKKTAKEVAKIYIASDPDREGEAIAFHVAEELSPLKKEIKRVLFFEITKNSIQKAFEAPLELNQYKYDAQKSRRVLDRLVGYKISPLLWWKVKSGLSAGRVQSVALRLICEREKEIREFVPQEYWTIKGVFEDEKKKTITAKLEEIDKKKPELSNKEETEELLKELSKRKFFVKSRTEKPRKKSAPTPFITSTLQQDAVRRLSFTTKRTMMIAQTLYEGVDLGEEGPVGLITYMRTDSPRISADAIYAARNYIKEKYGNEYLPEKPRQFEGKKTAQEAHECIRPTNLFYTPEYVKKFLTKEQHALYKMIFERFVASQMKDAVYNQTVYDIADEDCEKYIFRAKGLTLKFAGFLAAYGEIKDKDEKKEDEESEESLPFLEEKTKLKLLELIPAQNFTSPPPRYTEATLVKELEEDGIGRPSTYASIIATLLDKEYVKLLEGKFHPTDLGCTVSEQLIKGFPEIMDVKFTAKMEALLDSVEEGEVKWNQVIENFYNTFSQDLENAKFSMDNLKKKGIETDVLCELCGKPMVIKSKGKNEFLACSGYPDCKNIKNFEVDRDGKVTVTTKKVTDKKCPECGGNLVVKKGPYSSFLGCENYPKCKYTAPILSDVKCPRGCGGYLVERRSKKGRIFYGCSNYPKCDFIMNQKPINEKCPECGSDYLIETTEKRVAVIKCPNKECGYKRQK